MSAKAEQAKSESKPEYCFRKGEALPDAVRRVLSEQLAQAVQVLSTHGESLEEAVHEARRSIKRVRSVLRLIKPAIPNAYARENRRLRDVGRSLSELRDSHALIQTLDDLEEDRKNGQSKGSRRHAFADARTFLERRGQQIEKKMEQGGMEESVGRLKEALSDLEKLTYAKVNAERISKSIYKTVKRGMEAFAEAENDEEPEKFHEWRKRAKDLRYQLSLLSDLRPDLQPYSKLAKELEQRLGDDHNLAVLNDLLTKAPRSDEKTSSDLSESKSPAAKAHCVTRQRRWATVSMAGNGKSGSIASPQPRWRS